MNDKDWRYMVTVLPIAVLVCIGFWAGLVYVITALA